MEKIYSFLHRDRIYLQTRSYVIKFQQNEIFSKGPGKQELNNKKERIGQRLKAQSSLRVIARGGNIYREEVYQRTPLSLKHYQASNSSQGRTVGVCTALQSVNPT